MFYLPTYFLFSLVLRQTRRSLPAPSSNWNVSHHDIFLLYCFVVDGQRWWTFACVLAARHCIIALIICCTSHIGNKSLSLSLSLRTLNTRADCGTSKRWRITKRWCAHLSLPSSQTKGIMHDDAVVTSWSRFTCLPPGGATAINPDYINTTIDVILQCRLITNWQVHCSNRIDIAIWSYILAICRFWPLVMRGRAVCEIRYDTTKEFNVWSKGLSPFDVGFNPSFVFYFLRRLNIVTDTTL